MRQNQELVKARDVHVKNYPSLGDSAVNNREAARLISASTPFAGKAFDVCVDGTYTEYATALSSDTLQDELQRKLGLWLSAALPTLRSGRAQTCCGDFDQRNNFTLTDAIFVANVWVGNERFPWQRAVSLVNKSI